MEKDGCLICIWVKGAPEWGQCCLLAWLLPLGFWPQVNMGSSKRIGCLLGKYHFTAGGREDELRRESLLDARDPSWDVAWHNWGAVCVIWEAGIFTWHPWVKVYSLRKNMDCQFPLETLNSVVKVHEKLYVTGFKKKNILSQFSELDSVPIAVWCSKICTLCKQCFLCSFFILSGCYCRNT